MSELWQLQLTEKYISRESIRHLALYSSPSSTISTHRHRLSPETVLWLAGALFGDPPIGYVMAIGGINWQLGIGLSNEAENNFKNAITYFSNEESSTGVNFYPKTLSCLVFDSL